MLPATVMMSPALPAGRAARASVKTPTPVPAAKRAATAVARPRRVGRTRRRCCDRDIVLPPGGSAEGAPKAPHPMVGNHRVGRRFGRELSGVAFSVRPFDPFRVEGFLEGG